MTLLNVTEASIRLRTTPPQVRRLIKSDKDFPFFAYGSKSYRIIAEELEPWILQQIQKQETATAPATASKKTASKKAEKAPVIPQE